jgi:1-acyl-sn-glycerol-3-phosphate acyltransferase
LFLDFVPRLVLYLMTIPVVMFPFVCSILSDKGYPYFFKMANLGEILLGMGFIIK